ncbi:MAG: hypothetical protein H6727_05655 [Myxococcales bacterium]|nr:hypothetical protein [Myxococcales bacterium]
MKALSHAFFSVSFLLFSFFLLISCGPPTPTGCTKDQDCKGDRICQGQICVDPQGNKETSNEPSPEKLPEEDASLPEPEKVLPEPPTSEESTISDKAQPEPQIEVLPEPQIEPPSESQTERLPESQVDSVPEKTPSCTSGEQRPCYSAATSTLNVGECRAGLELCTDGHWGSCNGQVIPSAEICDGKDNDCNGMIDEAVVRPCFTGNAVHRGVGSCKDGSQTCTNGLWGSCVNQVLPSVETCDGQDNDCNGMIDDGIASASCNVSQAMGLCALGTTQCTQGASVCVSLHTSQPESCNKQDDDCDGKTDEGLSCVPSCLIFQPSSVDFGSVQVNCSSRKVQVQVINSCTTAAQILQVGMTGATGPEFLHSSPSVPLPATLATSQQLTLNLHFSPSLVGSFQGNFQFNLDPNSGNSFLIPLKGVGRAAAQTTETFVYGGGTNKTDILMIIDDSCSMSSSQNYISQAASSFFTRLTQNAVDYQLAVITTTLSSQGSLFRGTPNILTPNTANVATLFSSIVRVGTNGSAAEKGLESAQKALTPPNITNQNKGFLRADSNLLLLFVSDEDDSSAQPVSFFIQEFKNLKSPPYSVRVGVLTLPCVPGSCTDRYGQVWQALGGIHLPLTATIGGSPISANVNSFMLQAADLARGLSPRFSLGQAPVTGSISVKVGGNVVPQDPNNGWVYESASNSVVLLGTAVPATGVSVEVTYSAVCAP